MKQIVFELITPERLVFSEEIYEAILPTTEGDIAVLPNHLPIISLLKSGVISLRKQSTDSDGQLEHVAVTGGFVEVNDNHVRVLADSADRADEVDELKAKAARSRALELKANAIDTISLADATALLERSVAQLKLSEIKRRHHKNL